MSKNNEYTLLCGKAENALTLPLPALLPFDPQVMDFLSALSAALLQNKAAKAYPDIITFAFFCRRQSLKKIQKEAGDLSGRIGRGLVFHIAPGNVPINFAYSLVAALLSGNGSLVKASSQDFPQTRIVCEEIGALLAESFSCLAPYVNILTYPREAQEITQRFSAACDVRIIWGGDETVRRVREAPLSPFAFDVTFADRYSLLCLRPEAVLSLNETELSAMAQGFFNDTFLTDQNACTAPRLVYWLAEKDAAQTRDGQERFWQAVHAYAASRYPIEPVISVDKLTALYQAAVNLSGAERIPMKDNLIARIRVDALTKPLLTFRCAGGCFVEYEAPNLNGLLPIAERRVQTLSYLGLDPRELQGWVLQNGLRGIDRIVPIGKTMDFSLIWDGYDFLRTLTRKVQA